MFDNLTDEERAIFLNETVNNDIYLSRKFISFYIDFFQTRLNYFIIVHAFS